MACLEAILEFAFAVDNFVENSGLLHWLQLYSASNWEDAFFQLLFLLELFLQQPVSYLVQSFQAFPEATLECLSLLVAAAVHVAVVVHVAAVVHVAGAVHVAAAVHVAELPHPFVTTGEPF